VWAGGHATMYVRMGVVLHADEVSRHSSMYLHRSGPTHGLMPAASVNTIEHASSRVA
jgi:hypothetical protein